MSKTENSLRRGQQISKIISAAIGENGTAAIATRGTNSQSDLTVYNQKSKSDIQLEVCKRKYCSN